MTTSQPVLRWAYGLWLSGPWRLMGDDGIYVTRAAAGGSRAATQLGEVEFSSRSTSGRSERATERVVAINGQTTDLQGARFDFTNPHGLAPHIQVETLQTRNPYPASEGSLAAAIARFQIAPANMSPYDRIAGEPRGCGMLSRLSVSLVATITSAMLATLVLGSASARDDVTATSIVKTTSIEVFGQFKSSSDKARGISGMACPGNSARASRDCFVVNDEERFVEVARLTSDGLAATGKTIHLVKKGETGEGIFGVARDPMCEDKKGDVTQGKFDEFDGEGIAIDGDTVYVVGSHSCSGGGKYKPSSFLLARFKAGHPAEDSPPTVERSWRVADALLATEIGSAYGKPKVEGTNIEGVAVLNGRLYVGLRTPVKRDLSFIVSAPIRDLFAPGFEGLTPGVVELIPVQLGANTGIRDLAALNDGRLLILSGPTIEQDEVDYKLWLLEKPAADAAKRFLTTITTSIKGSDGKRAKAETVAVLDQTADRLKLLVLYDNIDEGQPTQYEIPLPPR